MTFPNVSIIILNWNGLDDTIKCLESVTDIDYPNYEIIIADNGSQGNDVEVISKLFLENVKMTFSPTQASGYQNSLS